MKARLVMVASCQDNMGVRPMPYLQARSCFCSVMYGSNDPRKSAPRIYGLRSSNGGVHDYTTDSSSLKEHR